MKRKSNFKWIRKLNEENILQNNNNNKKKENAKRKKEKDKS